MFNQTSLKGSGSSTDFSLPTLEPGTTVKHTLIYMKGYYSIATHMRQILTVLIKKKIPSVPSCSPLIEMTPAYYLVDGRISNNPKVHVSCAWHDLQRVDGEAWGRQLFSPSRLKVGCLAIRIKISILLAVSALVLEASIVPHKILARLRIRPL